MTIPENHIFARVASGGLLLVKVGPEPGDGGALGLTRKSARIEFFLWSLLLNKSARAKPLAAIWARWSVPNLLPPYRKRPRARNFQAPA